MTDDLNALANRIEASVERIDRLFAQLPADAEFFCTPDSYRVWMKPRGSSFTGDHTLLAVTSTGDAAGIACRLFAGLAEAWPLLRPAPTISQDVPAPAAVTAEMVREARSAWMGAQVLPDKCDAAIAAHLNAALSAATPLQSDLAADNTRLREAAAPFVRHYEKWMDELENGAFYHADADNMSCFARVTYGQLRELRAALRGAANHEDKTDG